MIYDKKKMLYDLLMSFYSGVGMINFLHLIKSIPTASSSAQYSFCFLWKWYFSRQNRWACFVSQGFQQNRKFSSLSLMCQPNESFSVLFLFLARVSLTRITKMGRYIFIFPESACGLTGELCLIFSNQTIGILSFNMLFINEKTFSRSQKYLRLI